MVKKKCAGILQHYVGSGFLKKHKQSAGNQSSNFD